MSSDDALVYGDSCSEFLRENPIAWSFDHTQARKQRENVGQNRMASVGEKRCHTCDWTGSKETSLLSPLSKVRPLACQRAKATVWDINDAVIDATTIAVPIELSPATTLEYSKGWRPQSSGTQHRLCGTHASTSGPISWHAAPLQASQPERKHTNEPGPSPFLRYPDGSPKLQ
jgi:hypothetical protein